ncbi:MULTISPECIES: hypothetical protein [unclassified Streptomyces]|uniref:hypothetical protein n=1 Tax=unclassified Streptomyces TaxID=2593676 RepID=UPI0011B0AD34|nr:MULTISPECIES: hypothetical protein [unclassified Streptomyces]
MLTQLAPRRRTVPVLLVAMVLFSTTLVLSAGEQAAANGRCADADRVAVTYPGGSIRYVCPGGSGGSGGDGGGGGGGGSATPTCDLSLVEGLGREDASYFCEGEYACFVNFPSVVYPDPDDAPGEPPTEDSVYTYKSCRTGDGEQNNEWGWFTPDGPTVAELAWEAYGSLVVPEFSLVFNPPQRSVIFIDTWWWAEGPTDAAVRGSSAGGVVAIAEPNRIEVDPGDGTGVIDCAWVTSRSDSCTHVYAKSDASGYPARARLVYDVRFENGGAALDVPGLPDSLESGWQETSVPVHEVQAIVE